MKSILFGHDRKTRERIHVPTKALDTHLHLIGGTGKGKTTALHTLLHALLLAPFAAPSLFVIDRLGNFSPPFPRGSATSGRS